MSVSEWVLAVVSFYIFLYWVLPLSIMLLFAPARTYFDKKVDETITKKNKDAVSQLKEKIEALGFTKLGVRVEKEPFNYWYFTSSKFLEFFSTENLCFASISAQKHKVNYYFITAFIEGHCIITANGNFFPSADDRLTISIVAAEPDELLSIHKKRIESMVSKGYHPFQEYTKETRLRATMQYYRSPVVRNKTRQASALFLFFVLFIVFIGVIEAIY